MKRYALQKRERLTSRKRINELFSEGKSFRTSTFLVFWLVKPNTHTLFPAEIAIGVPKKKIRKAVSRNLLKRRIREAYRKHKTLLYDALGFQKSFISFFVLYQDTSVCSFNLLEKEVVAVLQKLVQEYEKNAG